MGWPGRKAKTGRTLDRDEILRMIIKHARELLKTEAASLFLVDEDVGDIVTVVQDYMEDFNEHNEKVQANLIRDGSKIVNERIDLLTKNGVVGFLLVLLFLSMFLHPSIAMWVAAAIPVSFAIVKDNFDVDKKLYHF